MNIIFFLFCFFRRVEIHESNSKMLWQTINQTEKKNAFSRLRWEKERCNPSIIFTHQTVHEQTWRIYYCFIFWHFRNKENKTEGNNPWWLISYWNIACVWPETKMQMFIWYEFLLFFCCARVLSHQSLFTDCEPFDSSFHSRFHFNEKNKHLKNETNTKTIFLRNLSSDLDKCWINMIWKINRHLYAIYASHTRFWVCNLTRLETYAKRKEFATHEERNPFKSSIKMPLNRIFKWWNPFLHHNKIHFILSRHNYNKWIYIKEI